MAASEIELEMFVYVFDRQGRVLDHRHRVLRRSGESVSGLLATPGVKLIEGFELSPGDHEVRAVVHDWVTGTTASGLESVHIPRPDERHVSSLLLETRPDWRLLVPDDAGEYPFTLHGQKLVPAEEPAVRAGEHVHLVIVGHHLDPARATVHLIEPTGLRERPSVRERFPRRIEGAGALTAAIPTTGLEPGEHDLTLRIAFPDGTSRETTASFRVVEESSTTEH